MKGMVIWAQSNCRSMMALYRAVAKTAKVPVVITLWHYKNDGCESDIRSKVGFRSDEFSDVEMIPVGENHQKGMEVLNQHQGWLQLFCVWQASPVYRKLIVEARRQGDRVGVMCESPCNMSSGWRGVLKSLYMRLALPIIARSVVHASDFFINYSGDGDKWARRIGWPRDKIIPFGYFSPAIEGSRCVKRESNRPFMILATGILAKYRGADVLVEALKVLKERGVAYRAVITQQGELLPRLKEMACKFDLPIEFPGFLPMPDLIKLYEICSVYVGAGRSEPWGMRLNDALNCGAPLVVSTGMGGVKLVRDYGCGLEFKNEDANDLANKLCMLLSNEGDLYQHVAKAADCAARAISPENKAYELLRKLETFYA